MIAVQSVEIRAGEIAEHAGLSGAMLVTRSSGRRFLPILKERLSQVPAEASVILDCPGFIDASFADEVFGTLASERSRADKAAISTCFILRSLDETAYDNLLMALESRPRREPGLRNCVVPVLEPAGQLQLAGKSEASVVETFASLQTHHRLTARELAGDMNLSIAAASTRLKIIHDLGLAVRVPIKSDQGTQYLYCWPL